MSTTSQSMPVTRVPDHIPPELVGNYPLVRGQLSTERPHDLIQRVQDNEQRRAWYVPNLFADIGAWVFRQLADNQAIGLNTQHFSNANVRFGQLAGEDWHLVPHEVDQPQHTAYRKLLNPLLAPRKMAELDDQVRGSAERFIKEFRDLRKCEFMADFAYKLPINVFMKLMGLPEDRTDEFLEWERKLIHGERFDEIVRAAKLSAAYLREELDNHRSHPRDDLISQILAAEIDGRKLDEGELVGMCFNLFVGGLDTVTTHMGFFFRHLAENPQHQAELRANPERIDDAVEELMRAFACSTNQRVCSKDVEVGGILIRKGESVAISGPLAGRDRIAFPDADVVRFDRKPRTISFGYGPHLCIGVHLARRELRIAMETMLRMLPEFSVAPGAVIESHLGSIPQPKAVPLVW